MKQLLKPIQMTVCLATCATALLVGGCASSGYDKGNKTAENIQTAANRIAALPAQMDKMLGALDELVNKPQADLRPQYKQFKADVADVESAAKDIGAARRSMGEKSKEFFATWDAQIAKINNEDIKARSVERKNEVAQKMENIKRSYTEAETAFRPFMAKLQDVQKYLDVDLTAGGLAAIKNTVMNANADAGPLKVSILKLADDFKALGLAMSSVTPAAK
jgi:outer membrane murein-binding lipoprotein Lpp